VTDEQTNALDLATVTPWLKLCGACDAGLPMACTHPQGDYRHCIAALVTEVERLRAHGDNIELAHVIDFINSVPTIGFTDAHALKIFIVEQLASKAHRAGTLTDLYGTPE
jgi:hypothetical protein